MTRNKDVQSLENLFILIQNLLNSCSANLRTTTSRLDYAIEKLPKFKEFYN